MKNILNEKISTLLMMIIMVILISLGRHYIDFSVIENRLFTSVIDNALDENFQHSVECAKLDNEIRIMENNLNEGKVYLRKIAYENMKYVKPSEFNPDDVRVLSNVTSDEINKIVENTELDGIGDACVYVEKEYGMNALVVLSLAIHESGFGTNAISKHKNNIISYRAYNRNTFDNAKAFNSKSDCIITGMRSITKNYLSMNGKYFNGYAISDMNVRYAILDNGGVNWEWSRGITKLTYKYQSIINTERMNKYSKSRYYKNL